MHINFIIIFSLIFDKPWDLRQFIFIRILIRELPKINEIPKMYLILILCCCAIHIYRIIPNVCPYLGSLNFPPFFSSTVSI